jgi:SAM-dependent methyltransferase
MNWKQVWAARHVPDDDGSLLSRLICADGFDSDWGRIEEEAWTAYVDGWMSRLGLHSAMSVYEVGCGAGAVLYVFAQRGLHIAGIDQSAALIDIARQAIPTGRFESGDARDVRVEPQVDVVVSMGVFLYFPSLDYAAQVIGLMAKKATRAVAILDVADLSMRDADIQRRYDLAGGPESYAARYAGLDHLYYDRQWMEATLRNSGLFGVSSCTQELAGYGNAPYRFNCWGFVGDQR